MFLDLMAVLNSIIFNYHIYNYLTNLLYIYMTFIQLQGFQYITIFMKYSLRSDGKDEDPPIGHVGCKQIMKHTEAYIRIAHCSNLRHIKIAYHLCIQELTRDITHLFSIII